MDHIEDVILYSTTATDNLPSIIATGLRAGSYWTSDEDVANYYASTVEDDGQVPVCLKIRLSALAAAHLAPDLNGIEEPLTYTLGLREDDIKGQWSASDQGWQDSLDIIKTVRFMQAISADALAIEDDAGDDVSLEEFIANNATI